MPFFLDEEVIDGTEKCEYLSRNCPIPDLISGLLALDLERARLAEFCSVIPWLFNLMMRRITLEIDDELMFQSSVHVSIYIHVSFYFVFDGSLIYSPSNFIFV